MYEFFLYFFAYIGVACTTSAVFLIVVMVACEPADYDRSVEESLAVARPEPTQPTPLYPEPTRLHSVKGPR